MNEEIKQEKGIPLKIYTMNEAYIPPVYKFEKKGDYHFLSWGNSNQYPLYVLELYNNYGSSLNRAIINKKSKLSAGFGLKPILDERLRRFCEENRIPHLFKYLAKDFELYNGMCMEVRWSRDGSSFELGYIPLHTIRIGLKEEEEEADYFWYSTDWANIKKPEHEPEYIKKYDPTDRTGRQLLYYIEPNPAHTNLYPIPNYSTAINWIDLDYQISKFHVNAVRQGFAPSFILNFANGIPTQDEQNMFFREFQRNYKGADGAGKIMITYSDGGDSKPELIPIQLNNSDERFLMLQNQVVEQITMAHEFPISLISTEPGKLGSSSERKEMMAELQVYYTTQRQEQLEYALNTVLKDIGYTEPLKLKQYSDMDETGLLTDDGSIPAAEDLNVQEKAQAELKGSVGGVQGILSIQASVAQGITTIDSGSAILELIYGIPPVVARRMLGEPQAIEPTETINTNNTII